jgi:hypothetical protein
MQNSGIFTVKAWSGNLTSNMIKFAGLLDKSSDAVIKSGTEFGDIKLLIPANTIDRDVVVQIKKAQLTDLAAAGRRVFAVKPVTDFTVEMVAKDSTGNIVTDSLVFAADKNILLTIPYQDMNQDGIVDTINMPEQNLRIFKYENNAWKTNLYSGASIDPDQNTVSVRITKFGVHAIMSVGTEPTIDSLVVYPNPFNNNTKFVFNIGSQGDVSISIYTLTGRLIKNLTRQVSVSEAGNVEFDYDGTDKDNNEISNGTYVYRITAKNNEKSYVKTGKLVKLK